MSCKIAVILRTRSRPLFLARALEALGRQTFQGFRLYVVNDGGDADEVARVVAHYGPYEEERVVHVDLPASAGRGQALNIGLGLVQEEYVHIHDDDDTLEPGFYARTAAYLEEDRAGTFVGVTTSHHDIVEHVEEGCIVFDRKLDEFGRKEGSILDLNLFFAHVTLLPTITTLFRRAAIAVSGGVDTTLPYVEDQDFFQRLVMAGEVGIIPDFLANYHQRPWATGGPEDKSEAEFSHDAVMAYTNGVLRDAIRGRGRLRDFQASFIQNHRQGHRNAAPLARELSRLAGQNGHLEHEVGELRKEVDRLSRLVGRLADRLEER